jgi:hypothetical protein
MENEWMDMQIGAHTVRENLDRAVAAGKLVVTPEGQYAIPDRGVGHTYLQVKAERMMDCRFLGEMVFRRAYARQAVPFGCSECYKVKIVPEDFRGLIALRGLLEQAPYQSKCGADFYNPHSRDNYAGYVYSVGLAAAQAARKDLRARVDACDGLGKAVPILIKRGCSHMEATCGPSDRWTFRPGLEALETLLNARLQPRTAAIEPYQVRKIKSLAVWLQLAFNLKDDSYLPFLGGKPLHPASLTYPALEAGDGGAGA